MLPATKPPVAVDYNLNEGQDKAADAFMQFLFSNDKEFIISGPAGVGKTYLMSYIIDQTLPRYFELCELIGVKPEYREVVMTATTHKAAEALSNSINRPTGTVHSFFNLIVSENYSTGKTFLRRSNKWTIHSNKIIFIDESSMIDSELWRMLHEATHKCKLVYVGDHSQLAPIAEDLSPIYKQRSPFVELLQPVRNANQPALMDLCQQLRETVATGQFKPIQTVPGVIDWLDGDEMQLAISSYFSHQTHDARILAYTNSRVIEYNDYIRQLRQLPRSYVRGEYLVSNNAYHCQKGILNVETGITVRHNYGVDQFDIDEEHGVMLDVELLDVETDLGIYYTKVPVPTNREHFTALSRYYARNKKWTTFYKLKNQFADLRPHDAATVHKAQGSTYDTVLIDVGNISTCNISDQVARMLYVAVSRARTRVILYGELAHKYGGIIV